MEKVAAPAFATAASENFSRRAIIAGLAKSPLAALPAVAEAITADDPVLIAIAVYEERRAEWLEADRLIEEEDAKYQVAYKQIGLVFYRNRRVYDVHHLNIVWDEFAIGADKLSHNRYSDSEYVSARKALIDLEPAYRALRKSQWPLSKKLEDAAEPLARARNKAEERVLETAPTTAAGAFALLEFVASRCNEDDLDSRMPGAIRAVARFFERST